MAGFTTGLWVKVSKVKNLTMKKILISIAVATIFLGCEKNDVDPEEPKKECTIPATIVDLRGLDGCGYAFELANGERLEPLFILECPFPGYKASEDPLNGYEFVAGRKVLIEYTVMENAVTACQVGKAVRINCISNAIGVPADL